MQTLKKTLSAVFMSGFFIMFLSCSKQSDLTEPQPQTIQQEVAENSFRCSLANYNGTGYIPLAEVLFGDFATTQNGTHDLYVSCTYAVSQSGTCCSAQTIYLNGAGGLGAYSTTLVNFEDWCNACGGTSAPLSDGVMTVAEQQAFIDRVIDHAEAVNLPCTGGTMKPYDFDFSFDYLNGPTNASPIVKVSYAPDCGGGAGTQ